MTTTRAAAFLGGGALLVAWFAAAGAPFQEPDAPVRDRSAVRTSGRDHLESLAGDVQAQAGRLRERLARAPVPQQTPRNPFAFGARAERPAPPASSRPLPAPAAASPAVDAPVPMLMLIGVAEEPSPEGLHRTAMIAGADDTLYMVMEGQSFADRYRVTAIGADAVELKDLLSGAIRRLALR